MANEIVRDDIITSIEEFGEDVSLKVGNTNYEIKAVITGTTQNEDGDERARLETYAKNFRFVLPDGISKVDWNTKITYNELEYSIINVQTGVYDVVKVLAARDSVKEIGRDRRGGR